MRETNLPDFTTVVGKKKLLRYFTKDGHTVHKFNCRMKIMENTNTEDRYPVAPFSLFCEHYQVPRTRGRLLCTSSLVTLFISLQLQSTLQTTAHFEAVQSHTILMYIKDLHWGKLCYHGIFLRTSGALKKSCFLNQKGMNYYLVE